MHFRRIVVTLLFSIMVIQPSTELISLFTDSEIVNVDIEKDTDEKEDCEKTEKLKTLVSDHYYNFDYNNRLNNQYTYCSFLHSNLYAEIHSPPPDLV
ncbi:hypothetical protein [uncultured Flavobacterium sp.]|uniref:hypothetical protein n=1 Tax=uncultured Flavobacterium sp. TaxID=165435 RepID=UPI0025D63AC7|nr:hypothetical protein [uncultured Flavobacterium sp.]